MRASKRAQAHFGCRVLAHVIDVLRADARFDDQLFVRRHDVEQRIARADRLRRPRTRAAPSPGRRPARARTAVRPGRATAASALRARGSSRRIPSLRRSPAAGTGCAPARCAPAARRVRWCASARSLCALGEPAAIVGLVALQLQQPRALHVALAHELLVDLQLFGRELRGALPSPRSASPAPRPARAHRESAHRARRSARRACVGAPRTSACFAREVLARPRRVRETRPALERRRRAPLPPTRAHCGCARRRS